MVGLKGMIIGMKRAFFADEALLSNTVIVEFEGV